MTANDHTTELTLFRRWQVTSPTSSWCKAMFLLETHL